ncbi:MAG: uridine kinase [Bacteroidetes bacterium]|nr:uridine kinase [Bacteroidota bacterium]
MIVLGIAGGSGCGKTTFVRALMHALPGEDIAVIPQDAYYKDLSALSLQEKLSYNFDDPAAIDFDLLVEHVSSLRRGQEIDQPVYDFLSCKRLDETVTVVPRPVLILEGILVLTHAPLRALLDLKLFMHLAADQRLVQIVERDIAERGRDAGEVLRRYLETVRPMHERYVEPSREYADLIIPHGGHNAVATSLISEFVRRKLHSPFSKPLPT